MRRAKHERHPARTVLAAFGLMILTGTILLRLPMSTDAGTPHLGIVDALFWSTSATTVTGLSTTDVSSLSLFGEVILLALVQVGGFGIMTIGSVLALVGSRHVGLRQRMLAQTEIGAVDVGELRLLIQAIAKITVTVELAIAIMLFVRFVTLDGSTTVSAAYAAVFHAITGFNNAGISLYSDNLTRFAGDSFVVIPVSMAFIIGGLGFPILVELTRRTRPARWSLHTKITLTVTAALLVIGPAVVLAFEWSNPSTLGPMGVWDKFLAAWFQGTSPRTAGFSTIDIGAQREPTINIMSMLMFIGAGSASTSGGIKVTTFAVLACALWADMRGDRDVTVFERRLPPTAIRNATTVALLSVGVVFVCALTLTTMSGFDFTATLFESTSAFGTAGLSTGITGALPMTGKFVLMVTMLIGRVGPVTFVTALALRERQRLYRYVEERPIIG